MDLVFERRGDGPPLVLLHGIGHRWQAWEPVLDRLAKHRDVVAVDLPGFGASPPLPPGKPYTLGSTLAVLREAFATWGFERPHIAGNSLGGLMSLAAADTGLVSSATVLSPAGFFTPAELTYASAILRATRLGTRMPEPWLRRLSESPRRRQVLFGMIYARPELLPYASILGDAAAMRDAPGFEATLRAGRGLRFRGTCEGVPVTIGWGTKDRLLIQTQAVRAQRLLPDARFVWMTGCGHVPMSDDPELVARVLLEGSAHPLQAA